MKLMGPVDVKKKYNAQWALVTGAGSGMNIFLFILFNNNFYFIITYLFRYW